MAKDEVKIEKPKEEAKKKLKFNAASKGPPTMIDTSNDPKIG